jgi:hypothetical protein
MGDWRNRIVGHGEVDPKSIIANPRNWRIHPLVQSQGLEAVLDELGWIAPITINRATGYCLDGHLRVALAVKRGVSSVPVQYVELSEDEEALALATLDPLAAMAEADKDLLSSVLNSVQTDNYQVKLLLDEIGTMAGIKKKQDLDDIGELIDKAAELQEKWHVQRGQLWLIESKNVRGKFHRLMCGDSTSAEDVGRLMDGQQAVLGFTSPPYWVGKEYEEQKSIDGVDAFIAAVAAVMAASVRRDASRIVVNTGTGYTTSFGKKGKRQVLLLLDKWTNALAQHGWFLRHVRFWLKEGQLRSIGAKTDVIDQHCEFLGTYYDQDGAELPFTDLLCQDEVGILETYYHSAGVNRGQVRVGGSVKHWALRSYWDDIPGVAQTAGHCASFPVELVRRHLLMYTLPGELVVDWFLGAATTIVAAELLGRVAYGMEIEPKYCALSLERLVELGLEPRIAED